MNKAIQNLKMEIEILKKSQMERILEIENLGKRSGITDASITNRMQQIDKRLSGEEDTIENIVKIVEEKNAKSSDLKTSRKSRTIREYQI